MASAASRTAETLDVLELRVLRLAGIGQGGGGGQHRRLPLLQAESAQARGREMLVEHLGRPPAVEQNVVLERGGAGHFSGDPTLHGFRQRPRLAQHLPRTQDAEILQRLLGAIEAPNEELAGRDIEERAGATTFLLTVPSPYRPRSGTPAGSLPCPRAAPVGTRCPG